MTGVGAAITPRRSRRARRSRSSAAAASAVGDPGLRASRARRRIVAVDVEPRKLEQAPSYGATDVVNAARDEPVGAVQSLTHGGADFVFEAIGRVPTVQQASR